MSIIAVLPKTSSYLETGVLGSTLAVLPFFHIYAMELVMLFNLR